MEIRPLLLCLLVASCSSLPPLDNNLPPLVYKEPAQIRTLLNEELRTIGVPEQKPVVAIYPTSFMDQTGQRRSNSVFASFSTAVTQAPYAYLIRALKHAGDGDFFEVVERVGLDNVTKERQLIRNTREQFDQEQKLLPLKFAGLIMEGGVIGYESNIKSGGFGARYLGIGASKEYRQDTVTVSLRTVSVSTGNVLIEVLVTKTILSVALSQDVFRFISDSTELVEIENGMVENESINIALQHAVETAVLQTIQEGINKNYWSLQQ